MLSDDAEILAKRVADSLKCKLIIITGSIHTIQNFEEKSSVHPLVFLHILRDADFVVSTSFHGTAFSIIFEKQFYSIGLGQKSDRVKTMLDVMNMGDRYLCGNIDVIHIDSLINYSINKHYLEDSISFSRQWLEINTKACLENN